jgi:hypothetical protein
MLVFDVLTHTYSVAGRTVPSVTGRIQAAGLLGPAATFYTHGAAARGTRVHLACLQIDQSTDPELVHGLPPDECGYLRSYARWRDAMRPQWTSLEQPHYSPVYDMAGTTDRLGTLDGVPVVADLKTGAPASWHGIQLAMYDLLYDVVPPRQRRRLAVHLAPDGRMAQTVEYHGAGDYLHALELMKGDTHVPYYPDDGIPLSVTHD